MLFRSETRTRRNVQGSLKPAGRNAVTFALLPGARIKVAERVAAQILGKLPHFFSRMFNGGQQFFSLGKDPKNYFSFRSSIYLAVRSLAWGRGQLLTK
jgi:hypothetical protein